MVARNKKTQLRWPKGSPRAGKFAKKDDAPVIAEFLHAQKLRDRRQRESEARRAVRAARISKMAANVPGSRVHDAITGWGSTSTSRLRETKKTYWHGAFTISGLSGAHLSKILGDAGSSARIPRRQSDGNYSITLTPGYGWKTTKSAFEADANGKTWLDAQAEKWIQDFAGPGVTVEYHGAFYNPERE